MKQSGKQSLIQFRNRWQLLLLIETVSYAIGAGILIYYISSHIFISILTLLLIGIFSCVIIKPWKPNLVSTCRFLDNELEKLEYSSGLLLKPSQDLSNLAKLQQLKIEKQLEKVIKDTKPPTNAIQGILVGIAMILFGVLMNHYNLIENFKLSPPTKIEQNLLNFRTNDSIETTITQPKIIKQFIRVTYPSYINITAYDSDNMNIKAVEGSHVRWSLQFDKEVDSVFLQSMGTKHPMNLHNDSYTASTVLKYAGFYNFEFKTLQGNSYTSDLHSIEVTKDERPGIKLTGIDQYTSFDFNEDKFIKLKSTITDDYGIAKAYIIATVSKGSGESIKFREEQLFFDKPVIKGSKKINLSKEIDLNKMKMEPGDELYFYVEASDLKKPFPNVSRSETYFAIIKDTATYDYNVEGNLGVDRMPEYFRSQRQLIIDTEKLIKNRGEITINNFNFKSNELGFDQKALRLKYGAFMGEESEMEAGIEEAEENHDHEDPLAGLTHEHDSENEHNLVPEKSKENVAKNPLDEFTHNHDDPEEATLFTESLRIKLRKALNEMWNAELYLRLYDPEKSLPYQYKALNLIQDIKNSARIYVHRIGFDPPPIKEDKRLSGKINEVKSYKKSEDLKPEITYPYIRKSIIRLEKLKENNGGILGKDRLLFDQAGMELATLAIEIPGKYLNTLQHLKWISEGKEGMSIHYEEVQKSLLSAIPKLKDTPISKWLFKDEMTQLLIDELERND